MECDPRTLQDAGELHGKPEVTNGHGEVTLECQIRGVTSISQLVPRSECPKLWFIVFKVDVFTIKCCAHYTGPVVYSVIANGG